MAVTRWPAEDADIQQARAEVPSPAMADLVPDDSWSIKSEYGSNVEDVERHVDAAEASCPPPSDYSSDKDVPEANEVETSMLGLQSYWDATYAEELANFHEHGHAGEVWFGAEVVDAVVNWTKGLCANVYQGLNAADSSSNKSEPRNSNQDLFNLSVLDIGTGNRLLLQEFAKQGAIYWESIKLGCSWGITSHSIM